VIGSFLGLRPSGLAAGNGIAGVSLAASSGTVEIGGVELADRNVLSANGAFGIVVGTGVSASVDGNLVEPTLRGTLDRGNAASGIFVNTQGAVPVLIGERAGNLVRFNREGIRVGGATTTKAQFPRNDVYDNNDLGIDLVANRLEPGRCYRHDGDDADTGANNLQNFPVLTEATQLGALMRLAGSLDVPLGFPTSGYRLAFYASASCDSPAANGEGALYLGSVSRPLTNGAQAFTRRSASRPAPIGSKITSTATFQRQHLGVLGLHHAHGRQHRVRQRLRGAVAGRADMQCTSACACDAHPHP
jgi:hypothetical protein